LRSDPEEDDRATGGQASTIGQFPEVLVEGQERSLRGDALSKNFVVGRSRICLRNPEDVQAGLAKRCDCRTRKVLVGKKPHAVSMG
jgi:hypothetical protein